MNDFIKTEPSVRLIKHNEGWRDMPYTDTEGHLTIGYGTKLPLSKEEGEALMGIRLRVAVHDAAHLIRNFGTLDDARQAVIVDMAYNLGYHGFKSFKRFIAAVIRRDWDSAAREMEDSRWWSQVGERGPRLQKMILSGGWPMEVI